MTQAQREIVKHYFRLTKHGLCRWCGGPPHREQCLFVAVHAVLAELDQLRMPDHHFDGSGICIACGVREDDSSTGCRGLVPKESI